LKPGFLCQGTPAQGMGQPTRQRERQGMLGAGSHGALLRAHPTARKRRIARGVRVQLGPLVDWLSTHGSVLSPLTLSMSRARSEPYRGGEPS
jgi:hypothetical protein